MSPKIIYAKTLLECYRMQAQYGLTNERTSQYIAWFLVVGAKLTCAEASELTERPPKALSRDAKIISASVFGTRRDEKLSALRRFCEAQKQRQLHTELAA